MAPATVGRSEAMTTAALPPTIAVNGSPGISCWPKKVSNETSTIRRIGQLIDVLRAAPGKYSYATPGFGTSPHSDEIILADLTSPVASPIAVLPLDVTPGAGNDEPDALSVRGNTLFVSLRASGQLAALREMTLFFAPHINSYKRFAPGSFAPTAVAWGPDNRTCSMRVIGHGPSLRVESRVGGADVALPPQPPGGAADEEQLVGARGRQVLRPLVPAHPRVLLQPHRILEQILEERRVGLAHRGVAQPRQLEPLLLGEAVVQRVTDLVQEDQPDVADEEHGIETEAAEHHRAHRRIERVPVDERHRHPVVRGALGERQHQHEHPAGNVEAPAELSWDDNVHEIVKPRGRDGLVYFSANVHGTTTITNLSPTSNKKSAVQVTVVARADPPEEAFAPRTRRPPSMAGGSWSRPSPRASASPATTWH